MAQASLKEPKKSGIKTFQALGNPIYKRLWISAWFWYVPRMMELIVLSWLVLDITNSPFLVSMVGACRFTPMLLLGLVGGSLADKFHKKQILIANQLLVMSVLSCTLFLIMGNSIQPWHAFLGCFLNGVAFTLDFSARRALFSDILAEEDMVNAVSLDAAILTGSGLLGPLLGGSLIAFAGYEGAYIFMLISLAIGFITLLSVRVTHKLRNENKSILTEIAGAITAIRMNQTVWAAILITVALNFFGFPHVQLVPVIARDILGVGSTLYGILASATGLGAMAGTLVIASLGARKKGTIYALGATLMLTGIFIFSFSTSYAISLILMFIAGIGLSGFVTMQITLVLEGAEPEMRGRALGGIALGIGSAVFGVLFVGQLAEVVGAQRALAMLSGSGIIVMLLLYWRLPILRSNT